MFIKASAVASKNTEPKKNEVAVPIKTIRKTVRISELQTPTSKDVVKEPSQEYQAHSFILNQDSVANIWKEIMGKLEEPTHLVFFQNHTPLLANNQQLHLNIERKDTDNANALIPRIEKYFRAKTNLPISLKLTITESSKEEKERHDLLKEMVNENSYIQELIQNLNLTFE